MTKSKARKIILKAVKYYINKTLAVDANLYDQGLCDNARCKKASADRKEIMEAFGLLSGSL